MRPLFKQWWPDKGERWTSGERMAGGHLRPSPTDYGFKSEPRVAHVSLILYKALMQEEESFAVILFQYTLTRDHGLLVLHEACLLYLAL